MPIEFAFIIIFGVMLGKYLEESMAAHKMAISGFLVSIPVFSDVGYVILAPLAKAISKKAGIPLMVLAVSLSAGLLATYIISLVL